MLAALVVVLQLFASAIPVPHTNAQLALSLIPIVLGAVLFGPFAGAFLGAVMGVVIAILVVLGRAGDVSFWMFQYAPVRTIILCLLKSTIAGFLAGMVAIIIVKASKKTFFAVIAASVICPTVNTGIFSIGFLTIFKSTMDTYASSVGIANATALLGVILLLNFLPELIANIILAPAIERVIYAIRKQH